MTRLPPVVELVPDQSGWAYFLCTRRELRTGRGGDFLILTLQDRTGQIAGKLFDDVARLADAFDAGEFVRVEGRVTLYQGAPQIVVSRIRRVHAEQDRLEGFSEEACVPSAPRPIDEMWQELLAAVDAIDRPELRVLLHRIVSDNEVRLREWPAAQTIHHAYRGGLLEHVLKMMDVGRVLARAYGADEDLVVAGALLHDIGKLQELAYDAGMVSYTRQGNLVGHIALGMVLVHEAVQAIPGFPSSLAAELEHLVLSHHGTREHGSPVEPKTVEAFILAAVDELDARLHQVRRAIREDGGDEEFTAWHKRLGRVLYKGAG